MPSMVRLSAAAMLLACASAGNSGDPGLRGELTHEVLLATDASDLFSAIQSLRPQWLSSRGPTSASDPTPTFAQVAVNGTIAGPIEFLRSLRSQDVQSAQFLAPGQAAARYGMGHPRGVIEIVMRRR